MKYLRALAILALFALASMLPAPGAAQQGTEIDITLEKLQIGDQTLRGLYPSFDVWIAPPGGVVADDATFQLYYAPSPLLRSPSSMSLSVNDAAVWSTSLDGSTGSERRLQQIRLPRELLKPDINRIHFQLLLRLQEDDCQSLDNPARYLTIFRDSAVRFAAPGAAELLGVPDLLRFPAPFISPTDEAPVPVIFVMPSAARREHYTAAAQVAARLGSGFGSRPPSLQLLLAHEATSDHLGAGHVVLIGSPDELPLFAVAAGELPIRWRGEATGGWISEAGAPPELEDGLVAVARNPWNRAFALLAVTGATPEAVAKAGAALGARTVGGVASGAAAIVPQLPASRSTPDLGVKDTLEMALRDLGQKDATFTGQASHRLNLQVAAGNPDSAKPATLQLMMGYSPLMDLRRSSASLSINGAAVGSVPFETSGAAGTAARISIPAGILKPGANTLAIDFNLYLPPLRDCGPLADERAWASVLASSSLAIPQLKGLPEPDFETYPYPFVHNRAVMNVALLLSDDPIERSTGLSLAAALGKWAQADASGLVAGHVDQFSEAELKERHLLAYGSVAGNAALDRAMDQVRMKLGAQARPLQALSMIGITWSPWQTNRVLLLIEAPQPELLAQGVQALNTGSLSGALVLVDRSGRAIPVGGGIAQTSSQPPGQTLSPTILASVAVGILAVIILGYGAMRRLG